MRRRHVPFAVLGLSLSACSGNWDSGDLGERGVVSQSLLPSDYHPLAPAGDPSGPANFGWSVAVDGTRALVGANRVAGAVGSEGAAYVFEREPDGSFTQAARLVTPDSPPQAAQFGYAVSLSGDLALIGAPYFDFGGVANPGVAYLFKRNAGGSWLEEARLQGAAQPNLYFGYTVALAQQVFVGAWGYNRVYLFARDGAHAQLAQLSPPDAAFGDRFGSALAVDAGHLVVGAPYANAETGAVYLYEQQQNGSWQLQAKLAGQQAGDRFGRSVAIKGDVALVGSQNGATRLQRSASAVWAIAEQLNAPGTGFDYGSSVALTSQRALVGAYLQDFAGKKDPGAGYLFSRTPAGTFGAPEQLQVPSPASTDYFGFSAAASGTRAIVGAYGNDSLAANGGVAYVIDIGGAEPPCGPGSPCEQPRNIPACGTFRLIASQTAHEEGDLIESGARDFGRRVRFKLPPSIRLTSASAGTAAFLYYRDPARRQDVRCRYVPNAPGATVWPFDGCKISRAGLSNVNMPNAVVEATEVRFRLGGGDALEGGPLVAGDVDLTEAGACNAFAMDDCTVAHVSATRYSLGAERYEQARLAAPFHFTIPTSVPVTSANGAHLGQSGELAFWLNGSRKTLCSYVAQTLGANALSLASCSGGFSGGAVINADRLVLRALPKGFKKLPVTLALDLVPSDQVCTDLSQDEDGDGVPTLQELAESRKLGVADVDRDGVPNWLDSDANGNGVADGIEGFSDTTGTGIADALEEPCEPTTWYERQRR
ncbi:MAG TPA: FG-GAP repeat protein [Polyangiaceae bacterium]|nr:FG-GAP repeat protein [Polyangiaceae bacterium]